MTSPEGFQNKTTNFGLLAAKRALGAGRERRRLAVPRGRYQKKGGDRGFSRVSRRRAQTSVYWRPSMPSVPGGNAAGLPLP